MNRYCVLPIVLSVVLSSCATTARMTDLPLPACPADKIELTHGWIGDEAQGFRKPINWEIHAAEGKVLTLRVWVITVEDRRILERWIADLLTCAEARGAVIQEANK